MNLVALWKNVVCNVFLWKETSTEAYQNKKRIELQVNDIEQLHSEINKQREELSTIKQQNEKLTKIKIRHHLQILSIKTNLDQMNTKYNNVIGKLAKTTIDLDYSDKEKDKYRHAFEQKNNILKVTSIELSRIVLNCLEFQKMTEKTKM